MIAIIGITIVIGPKFQKFIDAFINYGIPKILQRKVADDIGFINSKPCSQVS
jgi:hypothetical protein